jgi:hypothetical protein
MTGLLTHTLVWERTKWKVGNSKFPARMGKAKENSQAELHRLSLSQWDHHFILKICLEQFIYLHSSERKADRPGSSSRSRILTWMWWSPRTSVLQMCTSASARGLWAPHESAPETPPHTQTQHLGCSPALSTHVFSDLQDMEWVSSEITLSFAPLSTKVRFCLFSKNVSLYVLSRTFRFISEENTHLHQATSSLGNFLSFLL